MLIVQLTDTHITREGKQARYLSEAIAWINGMQPQPAAVLVSGDTANTGSREEYRILGDLLGRCTVPVYVIPGNHDCRATLREALTARYFPGARADRLDYVLDLGPLRMIGLDTSKPRRLGGFLDDASFAWLEHALKVDPARPTLVFMHHPPFRTGVNAADVLGFHGVRRFRRLVADHRAVLRIVSGHVHCERRAQIAQALATTSISTAPQRVPELFERQLVGLRSEPAGFAAHTWQNGTFASTTFVNAGAGRFVERPLDEAGSGASYARVAEKRSRM